MHYSSPVNESVYAVVPGKLIFFASCDRIPDAITTRGGGLLGQVPSALGAHGGGLHPRFRALGVCLAAVTGARPDAVQRGREECKEPHLCRVVGLHLLMRLQNNRGGQQCPWLRRSV